jgi:hypothetical protein
MTVPKLKDENPENVHIILLSGIISRLAVEAALLAVFITP